MLEMIFVPVQGNDVIPSHLDVHVRIPNSRRTVRLTDFDLANSRLRYPGSGYTVDLKDWEIHESKQPRHRGFKRFLFVPPPKAVRSFEAERLELTVNYLDKEFTVDGIGASPGAPASPPSDGLGGGPTGPPLHIPPGGGHPSSFDLLTAFPILTSTVPTAAAPTTQATSAKQVISQVLGRTVRDGDQESLFAALDRQFVYSQVDGVDVYEPRSGPTPIQAGIGGDVSGAQLSLATLAQRVSDDISHGAEIEPLRPVVDNPQELEAFRATFRSSWNSFVNLVGQEGGFPVVRAELFLSEAQRALVYMGDELGMAKPGIVGDTGIGFPPTLVSTYIVTPDDARAQAEFQIVCDRLQAVTTAFNNYRGLEATPDYGIALVNLERGLDIVTDCVENLQAALASLGINEEEQQQIQAEIGGDPASEALMLSDLIGWCADLPEEGRMLLQSGVAGAGLLAERAGRLSTYLSRFSGAVRAPSYLTSGNGDQADPRLAMARVTVPLGLLDGAVARVSADASSFSGEGEQFPPSTTSIS